MWDLILGTYHTCNTTAIPTRWPRRSSTSFGQSFPRKFETRELISAWAAYANPPKLCLYQKQKETAVKVLNTKTFVSQNLFHQPWTLNNSTKKGPLNTTGASKAVSQDHLGSGSPSDVSCIFSRSISVMQLSSGGGHQTAVVVATAGSPARLWVS